MKIKKTTKPVSNLQYFNERDMLYDIKEDFKKLLIEYFNFLTDTTSTKNFIKIEEVAYELIEDYQNIKKLIFDYGWLEYETADNKIVVDLIKKLKESRQKIEDNHWIILKLSIEYWYGCLSKQAEIILDTRIDQ